jgi:hypothetical protein
MDELDIFRKDIFQAEAVNGMGMTATDFHDAVVAPRLGKAANFFSGLGDQLGIAEFIDVSHRASPEISGGFLTRLHSSFSPRTSQFSSILRAIAANFGHGCLSFTENGEQVHLFRSILLANFGHCKSHVDEHPVADLRHVLEQQAEIDPAPDAGDLDNAMVRFVRDERHNLSRDR